MKRNPFLTIMVIPHTEDGPKSLKVSTRILQALSVLLIIGLTFSYIGIYDYNLLKEKNENLKIVQANNVDKIHEYTQSYLLMYQNVKEVREQIVVIQDLEEKVKIKNGFDPTKSFFSTKNQEALQKNTIAASTLSTSENDIEPLEVMGETVESGKSLNELVQLMGDREMSSQTIPSIWPTVGKITSRFGYKRDPLNNNVSYHNAVDIANIHGTPIYATADGIVTFSNYNGAYGNHIVINHGNGFETSYSHHSTNLVKKGDFVLKGQLIAYMGSTGRSTSSHVHYGIKKDGEDVNPLNYMN